MICIREDNVRAGLAYLGGRNPRVLLVGGWNKRIAKILEANEETVSGVITVQDDRIEEVVLGEPPWSCV